MEKYRKSILPFLPMAALQKHEKELSKFPYRT